MTRLEASAFVEALDEQTAETLEDAVVKFSKAIWMVSIADDSRRAFWKQQLGACRGRLIDVLSGSESTVPTVRPL
jgi:hypothetical protein